MSQPDRELQLRLVNMLLGASSTSSNDTSANHQTTQYSTEGSKQQHNASSRSASSAAEHPVSICTDLRSCLHSHRRPRIDLLEHSCSGL